MFDILVKNISAPPIDKREILRYAGCLTDLDEQTDALFSACLQESEKAFSYRVCYRKLTAAEFFAQVTGAAESKALQERLCGCEEVVIFAASVGLGIDRLMEKYARISPAKALFFQAIGAERIEGLCEEFCLALQEEYGAVTGRFSAGYGDFPLAAQKDFFRLLDCPRKIGLTLNDGALMTPTKSVTAVVGIISREKMGATK